MRSDPVKTISERSTPNPLTSPKSIRTSWSSITTTSSSLETWTLELTSPMMRRLRRSGIRISRNYTLEISSFWSRRRTQSWAASRRVLFSLTLPTSMMITQTSMTHLLREESLLGVIGCSMNSQRSAVVASWIWCITEERSTGSLITDQFSLSSMQRSAQSILSRERRLRPTSWQHCSRAKVVRKCQ